MIGRCNKSNSGTNKIQIIVTSSSLKLSLSEEDGKCFSTKWRSFHKVLQEVLGSNPAHNIQGHRAFSNLSLKNNANMGAIHLFYS